MIRQLRRWRHDAAAFAVECLRVPLERWQAEDVRAVDKTVFTFWLRTRQGAKSRDAAIAAIHHAVTRGSSLVLFISGGGDVGSTRHLATLRGLVAASELSGSVADETARTIEFTNGSVIRCLPASVAAVVGWSASMVVIDEAQLCPADVVAAILPTVLAHPRPRVLAGGTATVASGWFYGECRRAEVGAPEMRFVRRVPTLVGGPDAMPWFSAPVLAAIEQAIGAERAASELRCLWQSGADYVFSVPLLEAVTVDYTMTAFGELRGPCRSLAGVDWAQSGPDQNALCAFARFRGERALGVQCSHVWPVGVEGYDVAEEIAASGAHFAAVIAEANGLGGPLCTRLERLMRQRSAASGGQAPDRIVLATEPARWSGGRLTERQRETRGERRRVEPGRRGADPRPGFATAVVRHETTAENKLKAASAIKVLFARAVASSEDRPEGLRLPANAVELQRDLRLVSIEPTADGQRISRHVGDAAMSLLLASRSFRANGVWRNALTEMHDGPVPRPESSAPTPEGAVAWQSVNGAEVGIRGVGPEEARPLMLAAGGDAVRTNIEALRRPQPPERSRPRAVPSAQQAMRGLKQAYERSSRRRTTR